MRYCIKMIRECVSDDDAENKKLMIEYTAKISGIAISDERNKKSRIYHQYFGNIKCEDIQTDSEIVVDVTVFCTK